MFQLGGDVEQPWLMSKYDASIKPEVRNYAIEDQATAIKCTKNLMQIGRVVPKMIADRHTVTHRPTKGKVFPYSLPSVGPGADPGVQAVSPQVT